MDRTLRVAVDVNKIVCGLTMASDRLATCLNGFDERGRRPTIVTDNGQSNPNKDCFLAAYLPQP
jgi:hypothetical protein